MARFSPFRGTRYDPALVALSDVVAPPYDVVGPTERAVLAARSSYNAIHVEAPEDPSGGDPYRHAARVWEDWHAQGVVNVDEEPAYYLYRMQFELEDGSSQTTHGVIGALALDLDAAGEVLPHEETTAKDRADRLSLLGATLTNLSPIWGLSPARGLGELCTTAAATSEETWEAVDDEGAVHTAWRVTEGHSLERISALVATAPVLIADGHHRYSTACAYASEVGGAGSERVMCLVVELTSSELSVAAIHRLVSGVSPTELEAAVTGAFEWRRGPEDPHALYAELGEGDIGLVVPSGNRVLTPLGHDADELDTYRLAKVLERLEGAEVSYQHGVGAASSAVMAGRAAAAFLLRPVSVDRIAATARGGSPMPPKTTYFRPKLRTGMVFRELPCA